MSKPYPIHPSHPERICWGCERFCPANALNCGNGSDRSQHPYELFGEGWESWGIDDRKIIPIQKNISGKYHE